MLIRFTKNEINCLDNIATWHGFVCLENQIKDKEACESLIEKGLLEKHYLEAISDSFQDGTYIGFSDKAVELYLMHSKNKEILDING